MEWRDLEALEGGFEGVVDREQVRSVVRRRWVLHGISLFSAFMVAGSILFAGGLEGGASRRTGLPAADLCGPAVDAGVAGL